MHVRCVAALRDYYGLEKRPVKVHEPYQMLGLLEDDLLDAMGVDVVGVAPRKTMFGFSNDAGRSGTSAASTSWSGRISESPRMPVATF